MNELYRTSLAGRSLLDTIDIKVKKKIITPVQAQFILKTFDEVIPKIFANSITSNLNFKGDIISYNFVDGVWKFVTKNFVMNLNNKFFRSKYMKIVACDADTSLDSNRRRKRRG